MTTHQFWAHSANDEGACESVREHLEKVGKLAEEFAEAFCAGQQGRLAGLLHDLGKYADKFQEYLASRIPRAGNHWSAGAFWALKAAGKEIELGLPPALAIEAHHTGLKYLAPRAINLVRDLLDSIKTDHGDAKNYLQNVYQRAINDGLVIPGLDHGLKLSKEYPVADMLDVRMLFSALADADSLVTEAHFDRQAQLARRSSPSLDYDAAIRAFHDYLEALRQGRSGDRLSPFRDQLQRECQERASGPQGLYTLSAPTGLGKTLAMLGFALYHARAHKLRRIILVMPYINIIDQTAAIYREIFSLKKGFHENFILEHHSLADREPESDDYQEKDLRQLLTQNWEAPIILTTNVQFFESLFSNRRSQCRKIHRIARSVVLFDEVQTIPTHLVVPTLAAIGRLTQPDGPYGVTAVFATATQPAFTALHERVRKLAPAGWQPQEIVGNVESLFQATAHRVGVIWRDDAPVTWDALARELAAYSQVLCIVNVKWQAARLFHALEQNVPSDEQASLFHLSTSLCPVHRREVLREVQARLQAGEPVRLISTQCVEAGVDLDFPVVYRALGPLEAIAQAAGRCNRHGNLSGGQLVVFRPVIEDAESRRPYPPGYEQAVLATEYYLNQIRRHDPHKLQDLLSDPVAIRRYYEIFYYMHGYSDPAAEEWQERPLLEAIQAGDFEKVADSYRLIREDAIHILVPYSWEVYSTLLDELRSNSIGTGFLRAWLRKASPYAVDIFRPRETSALWNFVQPIEFTGAHGRPTMLWDWYVPLSSVTYDSKLGLIFPETEEAFVI